MDFLTDTFNNRELAIFLWVLILIVAFLFNKKIRSSIVTVIKVFFQKYILLVFLLMLLYISLQIFLLYNVMLWDFSLVKDTVYWILGVASVLLVNVNEATKNRPYFKNLVLNNIKLVIIIEFIVNIYTFNFVVELFIFPIISFFVIIAALTEIKKEYLTVNRMANVIIGVFGFVVVIFFFVNLISDFQNFWVLDNLRAFLLPILLVITFVPFLYLVAIYMAYELLFARLDIFLKKDKDVAKYAKKQIFLLCNIKLSRLNRFVRGNTSKLTKFNDKAGIDKIVSDFKQANQ